MARPALAAPSSPSVSDLSEPFGCAEVQQRDADAFRGLPAAVSLPPQDADDILSSGDEPRDVPQPKTPVKEEDGILEDVQSDTKPPMRYDGLPAVLSMAAQGADDILSSGDDGRDSPSPQLRVKEEDDILTSDDEAEMDAEAEADAATTPVKAETQIQTPPNLLKFRSRKAGCENVDKVHVEAVVKRLTEGGRYHNRQKNKWKDRAARHKAIRKEVDALRADPARVRRHQYIVDHNVVPELEASRPRGRVMVCVDFDCYYASVEALDDPMLVGKPHAVTMGMGKHSILATTSYEARRLGVKGGIATFVGLEICPELILRPARMGRYAEVSRQMDEVLVKYDPKFCKASVDEAFLDITEHVTESRGAAEVVEELRAAIKEVTGLTVSAGCAPCLMLAKIASDMKKPDGQTILLPEKGADECAYVMDFIGKLPLLKVPGIGSVSEKLLQDSFGFETVADIYNDRAIIAEVFTPFKCRFLLRIALGIGCGWTDQYYEKVVRKGIGTNRTFGRLTDPAKLYEWLRNIAEYLEKEVDHAGAVGGRTFTVKLKTGKFESIRKSITLPPGSLLCTADDFELFARKVLRDNLPGEYRRIGLKLNKVTWKRRPRGSIKRYLKADDDVLDAEAQQEVQESCLSGAQIQQARERAKRFFYEQYTADDANAAVQFKGKRCAACETKCGSQVKHVHPYHCPVCHARCFKYLSGLNKHLDECAGMQPKVKVKEERKIHAFFKAAKGANAKQRGVKRKPSRSGVGKFGEKRRRGVSVKVESGKKSGSLMCPVCNDAGFEDNCELNRHVDLCLNVASGVLRGSQQQ